jgi:hypothetical protein
MKVVWRCKIKCQLVYIDLSLINWNCIGEALYVCWAYGLGMKLTSVSNLTDTQFNHSNATLNFITFCIVKFCIAHLFLLKQYIQFVCRDVKNL